MATAKSQINDVINTTASIKKSGKTDNQLQAEQLRKAQNISKGPTKNFKCSSIYAPLYPDGFVSTYQGVIINLIFDNRTVELPESVCNYVMRTIQRKADKEADRLNRYIKQSRENLGHEYK